MKAFLLVVLLAFLALAACTPASTGGLKTLVVLDVQNTKTTHKQFFDSLTAKGYELTFKTAGTAIKFTEYEEFLYHNLILFAPKAQDFGGELTTLRILDFMKKGGNVLVAGDKLVGSAVQDLVFEFGVEFDTGLVIDHFEVSPKDDGTHTLITSTNVLASKTIFDKPLTKPILFQGAAHKLRENPLVFKILGGNPTSFSGRPNAAASAPFVLGKETGLVSALQARNNARVTISGSLSLFSDEFFTDGAADNQKFAEAITSWTFQERGVLKLVSSIHHKKGEAHPPANYIIKEDMVYNITVQEWNGKEWIAFDADDMQLEIKMLDPQIRTTLKSDSKGHFYTEVKLPDVYGVFTFRVAYQRKGYTFLNVADVVPIHPLRHNQYERFIQAAYPYYASSFSMMIGLFLFSAVFLYNRDATHAGKSKTH